MTPEEKKTLNAFIAECVTHFAEITKPTPRRWDVRYGPCKVGHGPAFKSKAEARAILAGLSPDYCDDLALSQELLEHCVATAGFFRLVLFGTTADGHSFVKMTEAGSDEALCGASAESFSRTIAVFAFEQHTFLSRERKAGE